MSLRIGGPRHGIGPLLFDEDSEIRAIQVGAPVFRPFRQRIVHGTVLTVSAPIRPKRAHDARIRPLKLRNDIVE